MSAILFVIIAYAAYLFSDLLPALRSKKPGILWPCLILFIAGFAAQCLHEINVPVPSPAGPISEFVTSIFGLQ